MNKFVLRVKQVYNESRNISDKRRFVLSLKNRFSGVSMVKGIEFVIDNNGQKRAVLIDLKKCGEMWEDFYDTLRAKERELEPRESLKEVKKKILGQK